NRCTGRGTATPVSTATVCQSSPTVVAWCDGPPVDGVVVGGAGAPFGARPTRSWRVPAGCSRSSGFVDSTVVDPGGAVNEKRDGSGGENDTDVKPTSKAGEEAPLAVIERSSGTPVSASMAITPSPIVELW